MSFSNLIDKNIKALIPKSVKLKSIKHVFVFDSSCSCVQDPARKYTRSVLYVWTRPIWGK